jgi:hypothetical protein
MVVEADLLGSMDGTYLSFVDISYDVYIGYLGTCFCHVVELHSGTCI